MQLGGGGVASMMRGSPNSPLGSRASGLVSATRSPAPTVVSVGMAARRPPAGVNVNHLIPLKSSQILSIGSSIVPCASGRAGKVN